MTNGDYILNTSRPHSQFAASASSFGASTPPVPTSAATCSLLDILILPPPATPNPFLPTAKSTFFHSTSTTISSARATDIPSSSAAQAPMPYVPTSVPDSPTQRAEDISALLKRLERTTSGASADETTLMLDCPDWQRYHPPITHDHRSPGPPINPSLERFMRYVPEDVRLKRYLSPSGVFFGSSGPLEPDAWLIADPPVPALSTQRTDHEHLHVPSQMGRLPNGTFDRISTTSSPDTVDLFSPPLMGIPDVASGPFCKRDDGRDSGNDALEILGLTPTHSSVCFEDMLQYVSALDSPSPARPSTPSPNRQKHASIDPSVAHGTAEPTQPDSPVRLPRSYNGDLQTLAEIYESEPELEADDGSPPRPSSRQHSKSCHSISMIPTRQNVDTPKASMPTPPPTSISAAARLTFEPPASPSPFRQPSGDYLRTMMDRTDTTVPPQPEEIVDDHGQQYRYAHEAFPLALDPAIADELSTPPQTPADLLAAHLLPITIEEDGEDGDVFDVSNDMRDSVSKRQRSPASSPDIPLAAKSAFNRLIAADTRILTSDQGQDEKIIEKRLKRQLSATTSHFAEQTPAKRRIITSTPALTDGIERFYPYAKRYFSAPGAPESYTPLHVPLLPYPPAFSAPASYQYPNRRLSVPIYPVLTPFSLPLLPLKSAVGTGWVVQPQEEAAKSLDPFSYTVNLTPSTHSSSLTPLATTGSTKRADSSSDSDDSDTPKSLLSQDNEQRPGVKSPKTRAGAAKPQSEQKRKLRKQPGKRIGKKTKPKPKFEKTFWTPEEDDVCLEYWDGIGPISLSRMAECGEKLVQLGYPWRSEKAIRWRCFNPLRKRFEAKAAAAEEAKGLPPRKKTRVALDRNVRLVQAAQKRATSTE